MATASRFVGLTSSVLLEYVYADQSEINSPGNPYRIYTGTYPIWLMDNAHVDEHLILNGDNSEIIADGLPQGTGNVRDRSFVSLDRYKGALLDIDKVTIYNDYDTDLTNTASLPIAFVAEKSPVYDTIKVHLIQGFNFEDNQGFTLSIKAKDKNGKEFFLANMAFTKNDVHETLNPTPFFFAGKSFDSFVEIRVLSLYNLIYDYWIAAPNGDSVVEKVTKDVGILRAQPIQLSFSWISEINSSEDQEFISLADTVEIDLPVKDPFESISAFIEESSGGDYIEYYATHNGSIIENYIIDLNNSGGDYIVLHDLVVSESIYNTSSGEYDWVVTDTLQTSQTSDFDLPNTFRPIIKNGSAVAYKIDYTCRLYNRNDNSQIWRTGSMLSYGANKYGRKLKTINLGENPIQTKIYNKKIVKNIELVRDQEEVFDKTKYITSFLDSNHVSISSQLLNTIDEKKNKVLSESDANLKSSKGTNNRIFENGLGRIMIPDGVSYIKFIMYQKRNNTNLLLDVSGIGDLKLIFASNKSEEIIIDEYPNNFVSKTGGEVIFRTTQAQSKKILSLSDRSFKIFLENEKGEKSFVYGGNFYSSEEYKDLQETDKISQLEKLLESTNTTLTSTQEISAAQQETINQLLSEKESFLSTISSDEELINSLKDTIKNLTNSLNQIGSDIHDSTAETMTILGKEVPKPTKVKDTDSARTKNDNLKRTPGFYENEISKNQKSIKQTPASSFGINETN